MIAMKFTIELDIGLSFLLQAALPQLVTDRETKTHRRGRSKRSYAIADAALRSRKRNPNRDGGLGHTVQASRRFLAFAPMLGPPAPEAR